MSQSQSFDPTNPIHITEMFQQLSSLTEENQKLKTSIIGLQQTLSNRKSNDEINTNDGSTTSSDKNEKDYRSFLKDKISTYKGDNRIRIVEEFEETLENYFEAVNFSEEQKIKIAVSKLEGFAFSWWRNLNREIKEGKAKFPTSFKLFIQLLTKEFVPHTVINDTQEKLKTLRQNNRTIRQHGEQFVALLNELPRKSDEDKIQLWLDSINPRLRAKLDDLAVTNSEVYSNFSKCRKLTEAFESAGKKAGNRSSKTTTDSKEHPTSTNQSDDPMILNIIQAVTASVQASLNNLNSTKTVPQWKIDKEKKLCFVCHQPGHRKGDPTCTKAVETKVKLNQVSTKDSKTKFRWQVEEDFAE